MTRKRVAQPPRPHQAGFCFCAIIGQYRKVDYITIKGIPHWDYRFELYDRGQISDSKLEEEVKKLGEDG